MQAPTPQRHCASSREQPGRLPGVPDANPPPARPVQHFVRQLGELQFTTSELTETEELVESKLQQHTPRAAAGVRSRG